MKFLLDTHIFLWLISDDARLPAAWRQLFTEERHELFLSVVSIWEATIKYQIGKLPLPDAPTVYLPRQRVKHRVISLALEEAAVAQLGALPAFHNDPFDRMLICQARQHDLTIATVDPQIKRYDISTL